MKRRQLLHGRFALFNSADGGVRRTLLQQGGQLVQRSARPNGVNLHAPIGFVARPASKVKRSCVFFDEPAVADTLYVAGHKPASGFHSVQSGLQPATVPCCVAAKASRTAVRRVCGLKGLGNSAKPFSTT